MIYTDTNEESLDLKANFRFTSKEKKNKKEKSLCKFKFHRENNRIRTLYREIDGM